MESKGVLEGIIREMGIPIPGSGELRDDLRLSEDLQIDSLQFILFILKTEQQLGRKVFNSESIGGLKTISDVRKLLEKVEDMVPSGLDGIGKGAIC